MVQANSVVCPCKFWCEAMQIMSCVQENSDARWCKFHRASMQIPLCVHGNEWQTQKKLLSAWRLFTISEQKMINLRTMSFLNFSLSNLFFHWPIGLVTFLNGSNTNRTFKKKVAVQIKPITFLVPPEIYNNFPSKVRKSNFGLFCDKIT